MKKNFINLLLILSVFISLLLLGGCKQQQQGPGLSIFKGGTQGITANFEPLGIQEAGVYTVYDTEDFPLEVALQNKGEETVPAGKVTLRLLGPAKEDFDGLPQWTLTNKEEIDKISEFNPNGGEEVVSFTSPTGAQAKYKREITGYTDIAWNVEYSYDYKTHLVIDDVCFKGDITDPKVCQVKEPKPFAVSGAPLTVTRVEQDTAGKGTVLLKIDVENKGPGSSTVAGKEFDPRFDQVAYTIDEPNKWECKSGGRENEARFVGKTAQVICKLKNPLQEDELYTKTVGFSLQYVYKDLIQEKLRVKESVR